MQGSVPESSVSVLKRSITQSTADAWKGDDHRISTVMDPSSALETLDCRHKMVPKTWVWISRFSTLLNTLSSSASRNQDRCLPPIACPSRAKKESRNISRHFDVSSQACDSPDAAGGPHHHTMDSLRRSSWRSIRSYVKSFRQILHLS